MALPFNKDFPPWSLVKQIALVAQVAYQDDLSNATEEFAKLVKDGQHLLLAAQSKLDFRAGWSHDGKPATMNVLVGTPEERDGVKAIVVSWRGSDDSSDFKHVNLRAFRTELSSPELGLDDLPGKVHRGFRAAFFSPSTGVDSDLTFTDLVGNTRELNMTRRGSSIGQPIGSLVLDVVKGWLTSLQPGERAKAKIIFTGHSLGGALAHLSSFYCAKFLEKAGLGNQIRCITLASPRVFNSTAAQLYESQENLQCVRFIYNNDTVPRLPPNWLYIHVGQLVHLLPDGTYEKYPAQDEWAEGGMSMRQRIWFNMVVGTNSDDHKSQKYVDAINAIKELRMPSRL